MKGIGRRVKGILSAAEQGAGAPGGVVYELLAWPLSGTPDQGYANAQVLDTVAEGLHAGQLTVVEVDGTLAVVSDELAFTAQGTPTWGDQGAYSQAIDRVFGKGLLSVFNVAASNTEIYPLIWNGSGDANRPTALGEYGIQLTSAAQINAKVGSLLDVLVGAYSASTEYQASIVQGGYDINDQPWYTGQNPLNYLYGVSFYIHGGAFASWSLVWRTTTGNAATLYAALTNNTANGTLQNFRVTSGLSAVLQPGAFSSFTAANGTSLPSLTPEVGGLWTGATWDVQGNQARNVPTDGAELITDPSFDTACGVNWTCGAGWSIAAGVATGVAGVASNITENVGIIGQWYVMVWDLASRTAGSARATIGGNLSPTQTVPATYTHTNRAGSAAMGIRKGNTFAGTVDNVSVKQLTLSTLFASITSSSPDGMFDAPLAVDPDGTQSGRVINLDNAGTPANFVIFYHDGTSCVLEKCVAGTYTTMITAVTAFVADAVLRCIKDGTSYSLYYNGAQVGATVTIADAGVIDNTLHGLFSTNTVNRIEYSAGYNRTSSVYDNTFDSV